MSASCSMAPESRRCESFGTSSLSSPFSFARESCERTMTGTFSSFAIALIWPEMRLVSSWRP